MNHAIPNTPLGKKNAMKLEEKLVWDLKELILHYYEYLKWVLNNFETTCNKLEVRQIFKNTNRIKDWINFK